jgi:hypothetical protein
MMKARSDRGEGGQKAIEEKASKSPKGRKAQKE